MPRVRFALNLIRRAAPLAALLLVGTATGAGPARATVDVPLALGDVVEIDPVRCQRPGRCVTLEVACPQVAEPASVTLNVRRGRKDSYRGTILFTTGGGGRAYWSGYGRAAKRAVNKLRRKGFRIVQIAWNDPWLEGAEGELEGQASLACRPATVARWVRDNLHTPHRDGAAFCATGNSGGAAQVSYAVSHYGLAGELDLIVCSGGPPMGRIDLGCLGAGDPPNEFFKVYGERSDEIIDRGFGFYGDGPCDSRDSSFASAFFDASIASLDPAEYVYPETLVWFVFGEHDAGSAVGQGLIFHDALVAAGSPLVELDFVGGTPHAVPSTRAGANFIRDVLIEGCVP